MGDEIEAGIKLDLAHVLFIDIVGYSKLLITEQRDRLETLKKLVQETSPVRASKGKRDLIRLPTGDGMALAFRGKPEAPVECALEISEALKAHPELPLRMGIHSGPVHEVRDVNERANIAGAGIDLAQRVMDCGDAGHILLSKRLADDLAPYPRWHAHLHDLGEAEVKHGTRVHLFNLYTDAAGNAELPSRLRPTAAPATSAPRAKALWTKLGLAVLTGIVLAVGAAWLFSRRHFDPAPAPIAATSSAAPEQRVGLSDKSIAVLPFENLSSDQENAYFAEGVQDEILTKLASIADLKVISRTSTARYKSRPEDLKTVAQQLGVASVLEGTVQKAGGKVRVNVQLIDARADVHLWADTYDRSLTDIFTVESDIATRVADALQAKLTRVEQATIITPATQSTEAHDIYFKARFLFAKRTYEDNTKAIDAYKQAIAVDPNYALAYAGLAEGYASETSYSRTPAAGVLAQARVAAEKAIALNRDLPEAHVALGAIALSELKIREARREFEHAIALNSNLSQGHYYLSSLLSGVGEFEGSITEAKRALQLDPLSLPVRQRLGSSYRYARRYPEAMEIFREAIQLDPAFAQAQDSLGLCLELSGDLEGAVAQFQESFRSSGGDFHSMLFLTQCYGVKGDRAQALQTLDRAKELEKKAGAEWAFGYALAYAGLGEKEQAIDWLERSYQANESFALLLVIKVDPLLDSLRGNPRFDALADKIIPPGMGAGAGRAQ